MPAPPVPPTATPVPPAPAPTPAPPPIPVAVEPPVKRFGTREFTVRPNESYATLSQEMYHDQKYERALEYWLKDHGMTTSLIRDKGLVAGTRIELPQSPEVLEKEYPALFPAAKPVGSQ
jgi:hypothetical protein